MLDFKNHNPADCARCDDQLMITKAGTMPPFQLHVPFTELEIASVNLVMDLTIPMPAPTINKYRVDDGDTFVVDEMTYDGTIRPCGCGHLLVVMNDGETLWYSNTFKIETFDDNPYNKIEYWSDCMVSPYIFLNDWRGYFYFEADILQPKYETIEEIKTNENENSKVVKKVIKKRREFEVLCVEEAGTDLLARILPAMGYVILTTPEVVDGDVVVPDVYDINEFTIEDLSWEGCIASLIFRFTDGDNLINSGCCDELCPVADYDVKAFVDPSDQSTVEGTILDGESVYINNVGSTGPDDFFDYQDNIATRNGLGWTYELVPVGALVQIIGGVLKIVQVIDGGVHDHPVIYSIDSIVYGYIPVFSVAYITYDIGLPSEITISVTLDDLIDGIDLDGIATSPAISVLIPDVNGCGFNEGPFLETIVLTE